MEQSFGGKAGEIMSTQCSISSKYEPSVAGLADFFLGKFLHFPHGILPRLCPHHLPQKRQNSLNFSVTSVIIGAKKTHLEPGSASGCCYGGITLSTEKDVAYAMPRQSK